MGQWVGEVRMKKELLSHAIELCYLKQQKIAIE